MTEKEEIKALSEKAEAIFAAFQMLNNKAGDLIDSLTDRVCKLEAKVSRYESLTKDEILEKLSISSSTFYRKLGSGDIKEVIHGHYAVSRALYDKILGEPESTVSKLKIVDLGLNQSKVDDFLKYPRYVFQTP